MLKAVYKPTVKQASFSEQKAQQAQTGITRSVL